MPDVAIAAWDVGGAHLKCALFSSNGQLAGVSQYATPLWKDFESLIRLLQEFKSRYPDALHAVTMTAELVDAYASRKEGVFALAKLFVEMFTETSVHFFAGQQGFVRWVDMAETFESVASMNWFATASFLSHEFESGILIDVGSSTSDVIPFFNQQVQASGITDHERLLNHELLYFGVVRTPLMAVSDAVDWKGKPCPLMNEYFATTADVYRVLEVLNETDDMYEAADGKDKTLTGSARRLARMIALDYPDSITLKDCQYLAGQFDEHLKAQLRTAVEVQRGKLPKQSVHTLIGAGCGRFLLKDIARQCGMNYYDFHEVVNTDDDMQHKASCYATTVSLGMLYYQTLCKE